MEIKDLVRDNIKKMAPYEAPERTNGEIKLDQNESPYNLPKELVEKIKQRIGGMRFNRYSEISCKRLRKLVGEKLEVDPNQVIFGTGMDELFYYTVLAFINKGDKLVRPVPSFGMYRICAKVSDSKDVPIRLGKNFELTNEFIEESRDAKLTFICNPNSQTGNLMNKKIIEKIVKETSGIVFIDEAYAEFSKENCLDFLKYKNVIIGRTLSKLYSAAGIRLGYIIANEEIVDYLNRIRLPWNVSTQTQVIGEVILENSEIFERYGEQMKKDRDELIFEMKKIVNVLPTETNFISFEVEDPKKTYEEFAKKGIIVRNISRYPGLGKCLRISIGTPEENKKFIQALKEIIGEEK